MFLRAAAASKRVLLIDIASPTDMREFFLPALIDWTVGSLALPKPDFPWKAGDGDDREALFRSNAALLLPAQYLVVQGFGALHTTPIVGAPDIDWAGENTHCTQRSLFKPSDGVQQASLAGLSRPHFVSQEMTDLLKTMDITPFTQYTAVHLRFGGLIGEEMQIHSE
ncbi:MAG: hypothetical protein WDW36_000414 [Sanguina aurantia]